jgi:hypothetical protein
MKNTTGPGVEMCLNPNLAGLRNSRFSASRARLTMPAARWKWDSGKDFDGHASLSELPQTVGPPKS